MSQDIIADGLNQIMNAKQVEKNQLVLRRYSKLLFNLFDIMVKKGYLSYEHNKDEKSVIINILNLNKCQAVKPRYYVSHKEIEKYLRRFLPSRNFGSLIVSTNKGLMTHQEAIANKLGGSLIAYFY